MHITSEIIEQLLFRSEGADLDFKEAQYPVFDSRVPDEKKSELLKDILAMANSWRDGPAYILLGFKENKPNLPQVVGIAGDHLDDANLQQFIGSKVVPSLSFSYQELEYDGQHVAVFVIPKQARPFYAKSKYGKVQSNVVYVRRGSSTAEASPHESAKMLNADSGSHGPAKISLTLVAKDETSLTEVQIKRWIFADISTLPDFYPARSEFGIHTSMATNSNYYRELAKYISTATGCVRAYIKITNSSTFALSDCKLNLKATLESSGLSLKTEQGMPRQPDSWGLSMGINVPDMLQKREVAAVFQVRRGKEDTCVISIPKLLPGESFILPHYLGIFPDKAGTLKVSATLYASELPTPRELEYIFQVDLEDTVPLAGIDELKALIKRNNW